jgi:hypothetical protein
MGCTFVNKNKLFAEVQHSFHCGCNRNQQIYAISHWYHQFKEADYVLKMKSIISSSVLENVVE